MGFPELNVIKSPNYHPIRDTIRAIPHLLKYLTHIVILLVFGLVTNIIPRTPYTIYNILFIQILVSITSFYFIYINPKTLVLKTPNQKVIAKPNKLKQLDIFTHQIPLIIMLYLYYSYIKLPIINNLTPLTSLTPQTITKPKINYNIIITFIILYMTIVDVKKLYKISYTPLLMSLLLTILIFKFIL